MKFKFTMNMPTRSDVLVHQIVGSHPAKSLSELVRIMGEEEFIIVDEDYKDDGGEWFSAGDIALNTAHIGKVKVFTGKTAR